MNKILVVDDNLDILQIVKVVLENRGFEVAITQNGEEIFTKTDAFQPHLILMDVFLSSGIDGREVCKALKLNPQTKDIPVIMFSAQTKMEDVLKICKADDFIAKPFTITDLVDKIQYHLAQ